MHLSIVAGVQTAGWPGGRALSPDIDSVQQDRRRSPCSERCRCVRSQGVDLFNRGEDSSSRHGALDQRARRRGVWAARERNELNADQGASGTRHSPCNLPEPRLRSTVPPRPADRHRPRLDPSRSSPVPAAPRVHARARGRSRSHSRRRSSRRRRGPQPARSRGWPKAPPRGGQCRHPTWEMSRARPSTRSPPRARSAAPCGYAAADRSRPGHRPLGAPADRQGRSRLRAERRSEPGTMSDRARVRPPHQEIQLLPRPERAARYSTPTPGRLRPRNQPRRCAP